MRRTTRSALLALVPLLALLAACGTSGGDDASPSGDKATTTAATGGSEDTTTTEGSDDGGDAAGPSSAALADILPTVEDIGEGYEQSDEDLADDPEDDSSDTGDDESDPTEDAILEACPGAKVLEELDNTSGDNPDEVSREFATESDQTIEVALDPTGEDFSEENVDTVVEALADCGTIKTTDEDGNEIEMTIEAERDDEFGDYGVKMSMDATFEIMGTPVQIEFRGQIFTVDGVTVSVVATSGLDDTTFEYVPGDYDKVPELAAEMQDRVTSL